MGVVFKGGNSGSRGKDFSPQVPTSGSPQPVLRTETHGPTPPSVHFQVENPNAHPDHYQAQTPDFMPVGGAVSVTNGSGILSNPDTTDIMQQEYVGLNPSSGDQRVFKGTKS
jgi:hypothetical protein